MTQVSVIIPTFNRKQRLANALKSVFAQKGVSFEVIVVDDGSTDGTRELIAAEFPQVRYLFQSNQGPASARNKGIAVASGEYVAFLDADDEWQPGKLLAQMAYMQEHPEYPICQTEEIWIRHGRRVNPMNKHKKSAGRIFARSLELCLISPSAVMIKRDLFEKVGVFDESLPACEDYDLWLRITAHFPVGLLTKPYTIRHAGHQDQRSQQFPAMDRFRIASLAKILRSGTLTQADAALARKILERKSIIYIRGAEKRNHMQEALKTTELVKELCGDVSRQPN